MIEELFAKYGLLIFIIGYIFAISVFILYSNLALNHLKKYGYVGDLCQKIMWAYIIISSLMVLTTIIALIVI